MRKRRSIFLSAAAALLLSSGLAACGTDQALLNKIDSAQVGEQAVQDGVTATDQTAQANADADARAAEEARRRRKQLADLEKAQQAETDKLLKEGSPGGNDADSTVPIGSADPAVDKFRAKLAGICAGGQESIVKVSKQAEKAAKTKDAVKILAAAQAYSTALDNFMNALANLDTPPSEQASYKAWLVTINALATNVRLQLVSQSDPVKARKLAVKTTDLTTKLVEQSAELGVTCLSVT